MIIEIKQKHIDAGKPDNSGRCPTALAIRDAIPNCLVNVSYSCIVVYIDWPRLGKIWLAPSVRVRRFIKRFDQHKSVKPIRFHLRIPSGRA